MPGDGPRLKRFYVPPEVMDSPSPFLNEEETYHAVRVLRLNRRDRIEVFDGMGRSAEAEVLSFGGKTAVLKLRSEIARETAPPTRIILAQALIRREKMKFVVQKAVEIGVSAIWLFECERSVVHGKKPSSAKHHDRRYDHIIIEAMKQCRSNFKPELIGPVSFPQVLGRLQSASLRLLFWEEHPGISFRLLAHNLHNKICGS